MADSPIDATFIAFQQAIAGRYFLERELGRGGMGVVYLAREVRLDRRVAIKLLPPELAAQGTLRDRFMREARTAARLSHPYIVPLHTVDEVDGFVFYVMAYVDGETLAQRVASRGPLSPREATRVLREVSWALAYAHAQGVVHRDIKPANILLEQGTERALVTDFGIARVVQSGGETAVGELLGTPEYMSPEQAAGESVDGRSDLYSLGIVAWYALTGRLPFQAPTAQALLAQQITKPAPPLASLTRGVPRQLAQAVDRCLQKDPAQRYANGEALADALAPSLEKQVEIPVPVRVVLDRRRAVALVIPLAMGLPLAMGVATSIGEHGATLGRVGALTLIVAAALTLPVGIAIRRLRKLARLGYGPEDLAAGLRIRFGRQREEFLYEFGPMPTLRERAVRALGIAGMAAGGIGVAALAMTGGNARAYMPVAVLGLYAGLIAAIQSTYWRRLRGGKEPFWATLWDGKLGRALGRLAAYRLGSRAVAAERPTEQAIAMSASSLYDALPRELRATLGDVPKILQGLESHARSIRAKVEKLEAAIGEAQVSRATNAAGDRQEALLADLRDARVEAEARLADVVTALETLRLDLLRLSAGAGSAEGVTRALEAARALSDEAERMLSGRREVEEALLPGDRAADAVSGGWGRGGR